MIGATIYVGAYILSALDTLPSQSWQYYVLKMVAAGLVLTSLVWGDFNLAAAVIQVFFVGVSLLGLGLHWGKKQRARAYHRARATLNLEEQPPENPSKTVENLVRQAAE